MNEFEEVKPDNWLAWSILSTLFCCLPAGIVAIVYSSKVDGLWFGGQKAAAADAARKAKTWTLVSVIAAAAGWIIYLVLYLVLYVGIAAMGH